MVIDLWSSSPRVLQNIFFCLPSETGEAQGLTGTVARFSRMGPYFLQTPKCRGAPLPSDEGADRNRRCWVFLCLRTAKEPWWRAGGTVLDRVCSLPMGWHCRVGWSPFQEESRVSHWGSSDFSCRYRATQLFVISVRSIWDAHSGAGIYELQSLSLKMLLLLF